ncbi:MAG: protease inhibitor I42 family protein [Actinobacteria bacterium]|nr:protease inhibitor I42 family protein [Actinomycetota bacterium]
MRKLMNATVIAAAAAALTLGVTGTSGAVTLTKNPDPTLVVLRVPTQVWITDGEAIVLSQETSKSTGYSWKVKVAGDKSAVKVDAGEYQAPASTGMVGVAGTTTWYIKALAPGQAVLSLIATPPGGGSPTTKKLTITVMN